MKPTKNHKNLNFVISKYKESIKHRAINEPNPEKTIMFCLFFISGYNQLKNKKIRDNKMIV